MNATTTLDPKTLGFWTRCLRQASHLSQEALALASGLDVRTIQGSGQELFKILRGLYSTKDSNGCFDDESAVTASAHLATNCEAEHL